MSLIQAYPLVRQLPISPDVTVDTPASSVPDNATLISTVSLSNLVKDTNLIGSQLGAGTFFVTSSVTVSGNPPSSSVIPALVVGFSYQGNTGTVNSSLQGVTAQGDSVVDGFNQTSSVQFDSDGQGVVSAKLSGGNYQSNQNWGYSITLQVYKVA